MLWCEKVGIDADNRHYPHQKDQIVTNFIVLGLEDFKWYIYKGQENIPSVSMTKHTNDLKTSTSGTRS